MTQNIIFTQKGSETAINLAMDAGDLVYIPDDDVAARQGDQDVRALPVTAQVSTQ
jgi:hypothetical protein